MKETFDVIKLSEDLLKQIGYILYVADKISFSSMLDHVGYF